MHRPADTAAPVLDAAASLAPAVAQGLSTANWIDLSLAVIGVLGLLITISAIIFVAGKVKGSIDALKDAMNALAGGFKEAVSRLGDLEEAKAGLASAQMEMERRVLLLEGMGVTVDGIKTALTRLQTTQELQDKMRADNHERLQRGLEQLSRQLGHVVAGDAGAFVQLPAKKTPPRGRTRR